MLNEKSIEKFLFQKTETYLVLRRRARQEQRFLLQLGRVVLLASALGILLFALMQRIGPSHESRAEIIGYAIAQAFSSDHSQTPVPGSLRMPSFELVQAIESVDAISSAEASPRTRTERSHESGAEIVFTITPAEPKAEPARTDSKPTQVCTVKSPTCHPLTSGDTYAKLAKQYLGDARRWKEIAALNSYEPRNLPDSGFLRIPATEHNAPKPVRKSRTVRPELAINSFVPVGFVPASNDVSAVAEAPAPDADEPEVNKEPDTKIPALTTEGGGNIPAPAELAVASLPIFFSHSANPDRRDPITPTVTFFSGMRDVYEYCGSRTRAYLLPECEKLWYAESANSEAPSLAQMSP